MNKRHDEVVELAGIIENKMTHYEDSAFPDVAAIDAADEILNLGYHKTVWHKVSDGDLPEEYNEVRFITDTGYYHNGCYVKVKNAFYYDGDIKYNLDEVIAWTELPTYEEQGI